MKIKVMSIFGTRPEAIKMAPLIKELEKEEKTDSIVCVTAQHRQMLDQVLKIYNIHPDYDLNIMKKNQTIGDITVTALKKLEAVISEAKPDIVLVHGDTTTSLAGALAAFYNQVPIGHVEAGLRTNNKYSPFPEEMNRQIVDRLSDFCFAPTKKSQSALLKEGIDKKKIYVTGNTAIDALFASVKEDYHHRLLDWSENSRLVVLTAHRRENQGEPMRNIFKGIKRAVDEIDDVKVLYPIHLSPTVRVIANEVFGDDMKIRIVEPLDVYDFHNIINKSYVVLTDSGGIQEEAPSLGKPVLVLRNDTERPEGIKAGTLRLVGTSEEAVYKEVKKILTNHRVYKKMSKATNPYGDGSASKKIVSAIVDNLKAITSKGGK